jgi:DNA-binding NtrC family response regulator
VQEHFRHESPASVFGLVGDSPYIQEFIAKLVKLTSNRSNVLLRGETGTGKEVIARALQAVSPGPSGKFVPINVAALSPHLIESELFGHTRSAFTGATEKRVGLIEAATGGTLFLDEVSELMREVQVKLLRVLENREIRPVGSNRTIPSEFRLIAAANLDLRTEVEEGRFRADLFYRINVIPLFVAPLRERRQDIPLLLQYYVEKFNSGPKTISESALVLLSAYDWPGNIRELKNCVERISAIKREEIGPGDLPEEILVARVYHVTSPAAPPQLPPILPLADVIRTTIAAAMKIAGGSRREAARALGVGRTTLYRHLRDYQSKPLRGASAA